MRKNVGKEVEIFLDKYFGIKDIQCCNDDMIVAAMEFLAVAKYFKKQEEDYAAIKKAAANILYATLGTANPDYGPNTKMATLAMMRTQLFTEGARV